MKYFDTYFCHYTLCTSVYVRVTQHTFALCHNISESTRQKAIIVKLPKVIVITELTKQIRRNTNMLLYLKQSSLSVSELIKMIMWSYLCELSSLVKIFCEESGPGPDLRRQSDEWKTGPSQKHFRLSYQRNCEQRRGPEESVSIEPEWWHLGLRNNPISETK